MSWMQHHTQSEALANEADIALRSGDAGRAIELYRQAAVEETRALHALEPHKKRTLGITAVSAASLWFKARDFREVEHAVHSWLSDTESLPGFATEQLKTILLAAWNEESFTRLGVEFVKGDVLVAVKGGVTVPGGAPLDLVHQKVEQIRQFFYRTIEWTLQLPFRRSGVPSTQVQQQFRPWLFYAPTSSYQFAVRIQRPPQLELFPGFTAEVEDVTMQFFQILGAATEQSGQELEVIVPDADYRGAFLQVVRNLAPTGKTFDRLEIRSATEYFARPIVLSVDSRADLNQEVRRERNRLRGEQESGHQEVQLRGTLRALHLDQDWIGLHADDREGIIAIYETGDVIDDIVGAMVNERVIVDVVIRPDGRHLYRDIQLEE